MLEPEKRKFRKEQRGKIKGKAQRGMRLNFGDFGLKAMEPAWITSRQIEACRITLTREMEETGKVWINIFPHKPISKTPAETRMGKGKGAPEYYAAVVKPGRVMFEISGIDEEAAYEAFRKTSAKLPIKVKMVTRTPGEGRRI